MKVSFVCGIVTPVKRYFLQTEKVAAVDCFGARAVNYVQISMKVDIINTHNVLVIIAV
jgi:hypothetical protein